MSKSIEEARAERAAVKQERVRRREQDKLAGEKQAQENHDALSTTQLQAEADGRRAAEKAAVNDQPSEAR